MLDKNEDIEDSLKQESGDKKSNLKLYIIIGISMICVIAIIVIIILLVKGGNDSKEDIKVNLSTIPLPEDIEIEDGHYLFDGNIFINYRRSTTNYTYFGVISDNGKKFKELYGENSLSLKKPMELELSLLEITKECI